VISEMHFLWCIWNILVILVLLTLPWSVFCQIFHGWGRGVLGGGGGVVYRRGTWCRQLTARCNVYMQWNVWWTKATKKNWPEKLASLMGSCLMIFDR
jgi:hypothetical protein